MRKHEPLTAIHRNAVTWKCFIIKARKQTKALAVRTRCVWVQLEGVSGMTGQLICCLNSCLLGPFCFWARFLVLLHQCPAFSWYRVKPRQSGDGLVAPRKVGGWEKTTAARAASPALRKESGWRQPNYCCCQMTHSWHDLSKVCLDMVKEHNTLCVCRTVFLDILHMSNYLEPC